MSDIGPETLVGNILLAVQKYRSNGAEELVGMGDVPEQLQPWTIGGRVMPMLMRLSGETPPDLFGVFNLLTIAHTLAPEIALSYALMFGEELPEPMAYLQSAKAAQAANEVSDE